MNNDSKNEAVPKVVPGEDLTDESSNNSSSEDLKNDQKLKIFEMQNII